jgi:hypothetical protein
MSYSKQATYKRLMSLLSIENRKSSRPRFVLRRHLNKLRWVVLSVVFALLILLPFLHLYQTYLAAYGYDLLDADKKFIFQTMETLTSPFTDNPVEDLDNIKGTTWTGTLFGLKISDPLAVVGHIANKRPPGSGRTYCINAYNSLATGFNCIYSRFTVTCVWALLLWLDLPGYPYL